MYITICNIHGYFLCPPMARHIGAGAGKFKIRQSIRIDNSTCADRIVCEGPRSQNPAFCASGHKNYHLGIKLENTGPRIALTRFWIFAPLKTAKRNTKKYAPKLLPCWNGVQGQDSHLASVRPPKFALPNSLPSPESSVRGLGAKIPRSARPDIKTTASESNSKIGALESLSRDFDFLRR